MWVSMVLLSVLAITFAAPQGFQEYSIENVGGPSYKVSSSNSGFNIETSGEQASSSFSRSSAEKYGTKNGFISKEAVSTSILPGNLRPSLSIVAGHRLATEDKGLSHGLDGNNFFGQHVATRPYESEHGSSADSSIGTLQSSFVSDRNPFAFSGGSVVSTAPAVFTEKNFVLAPTFTRSENVPFYKSENQDSSVKATQKMSLSANPVVHRGQTAHDMRYGTEASLFGTSYVTSKQATQSAGQRFTDSYSSINSLSQQALLGESPIKKSTIYSTQKPGIPSEISFQFQSDFLKGPVVTKYGLQTSSVSGVSGLGSARTQSNKITYGQQSRGSIGTKSSASVNIGRQHLDDYRTRNSFPSSVSVAYTENARDAAELAHRSAFTGHSGQAVNTLKPISTQIKSEDATYKSAAPAGYSRLSLPYEREFGVERLRTVDESSRKSGYGINVLSGTSFGRNAFRSGSGYHSIATSHNVAGGLPLSSMHVSEDTTLHNSHILQQTQDQSEDGSQFSFSFDTANGISMQSSGSVKDIGTDNESQVITGSYSYLGDDGQTYTVDYIADENGFRPQGAHLHPIPEEIQWSIKHNLVLPDIIVQ